MGAERWPQSRADTEAVPNPIGSFFARRRFRPTLWPTLGVAVLVAATASLGNWQRHRGLEKEALREQYERAARQSPLELTGVSADAAALRFRPVRASGVFDGRRQVLIDNKVYRGRPGFDVVTPLKLASGDRYVLVDRGWIAQGAHRSELPQAPPRPGAIRVEGRITLPPAHYLELKMDASTGPVRQNLDIDRIAAATGLPLPPFVIEQTGDAGDSDRRGVSGRQSVCACTAARQMVAAGRQRSLLRRRMPAYAVRHPRGANDPGPRAGSCRAGLVAASVGAAAPGRTAGRAAGARRGTRGSGRAHSAADRRR